MSGIGLAAWHAATTTIQNLAFAWLVGSVLLGLWIGRATEPQQLDLHRRLSRSTTVAAGTLIATQIVLLWLEAAVMADVPLLDAMPAISDVLSGTHFGAVWSFGLAASAILVLLTLRTNHGAERIHASALAIVLAAFAYTRSLISHAAAHGDLAFAVVLDWIHLLFISVWVGEVLVATLTVLPRLNSVVMDESLAPQFVHALSRSATIVLVGVLVTGVAKAWQSIGSPDNLLGNAYGNVLTIKLILVAVAIGLGGFNRFFVLPIVAARSAHTSAEQKRTGLARFLLILRLETFVLICVTIAAAVLSATAPPMDGQ